MRRLWPLACLLAVVLAPQCAFAGRLPPNWTGEPAPATQHAAQHARNPGGASHERSLLQPQPQPRRPSAPALTLEQLLSAITVSSDRGTLSVDAPAVQDADGGSSLPAVVVNVRLADLFPEEQANASSSGGGGRRRLQQASLSGRLAAATAASAARGLLGRRGLRNSRPSTLGDWAAGASDADRAAVQQLGFRVSASASAGAASPTTGDPGAASPPPPAHAATTLLSMVGAEDGPAAGNGSRRLLQAGDSSAALALRARAESRPRTVSLSELHGSSGH